jgi:hypothetical protein
MLAVYFTLEFLKSLPADDLEACVALSTEHRRFEQFIVNQVHNNDFRNNLRDPYHDDYIEILAIFRSFTESRKVILEGEIPIMGPNKMTNIMNIVSFLQNNGTAWTRRLAERTSGSVYAEKSEHYASVFGSVEVYKFSDTDLQKIQELVNS